MDVVGLIRRYGDPVLAGVLAVMMTLELTAWAKDDLGRSVLWGLLATLPLAMRRKSPLVAFVVVMLGIGLLSFDQPGFDNDSMTFVSVFVIALYSVGRNARGVEAWLGGVAVIGTMVSFMWNEGMGGTELDLGDVAFLLGFVGAPWAAGLTLRLRRERETQLNAENDQLRREQEERARRAVAEERARIARELHDVVAHAISVTVLQARGARRAMIHDPETARQALDAIEQTNAAALGDMRRLLSVLRDVEPDGYDPETRRMPQPSLAQLDLLIDEVRGSGVAVSVEVRGTELPLPPGVDLSAYRIVQEALTNVLKHAAQASAHIVLEYGDDALGVTVADDGDANRVGDAKSGGHGLIGIQERVAVVGGSLAAGPRPDGGFEVRARLPYSVELS